MPHFSKNLKRMLRELSGQAYEMELQRELAALSQQFDRWSRDEIDSFELSDAIHQFHNGPSRELFSRDQDGLLEFNVASAVHRGLIRRDALPQPVLEALGPQLAYLESALDHDENREP